MNFEYDSSEFNFEDEEFYNITLLMVFPRRPRTEHFTWWRDIFFDKFQKIKKCSH